jgi:plasmid stability protein
MHATMEYSAGTMSRQYTIRSVPTEVDQALRLRAQQEAKSLNTVAVEALARGLELDATKKVNHDLDDLIGSWEEDPAFDRAMEYFERIDEEIWR